MYLYFAFLFVFIFFYKMLLYIVLPDISFQHTAYEILMLYFLIIICMVAYPHLWFWKYRVFYIVFFILLIYYVFKVSISYIDKTDFRLDMSILNSVVFFSSMIYYSLYYSDAEYISYSLQNEKPVFTRAYDTIKEKEIEEFDLSDSSLSSYIDYKLNQTL